MRYAVEESKYFALKDFQLNKKSIIVSFTAWISFTPWHKFYSHIFEK
jgi:hypothetical protein